MHYRILASAAVLALIGLARLVNVFAESWTDYEGELYANFPGFLILRWLNPTVYDTVGNTFWGKTVWFYGPFHHFAYLPLLAFVTSVPLFFQILLMVFTAGIMAGLAAIASTETFASRRDRALFLVLLLGITFNQFAVLDNLHQRNTELLEFILLMAALVALTRHREVGGGVLLALAGLTKLLPMIYFIALPLKRARRALGAYLLTALVVVALAEVLLGWENYHLLRPEVATSVGAPSLEAIRDGVPFTEPSPQRGSFYSFWLLPHYDITFHTDTPRPTIQRRIGSGLAAANVGFLVVVLLIGLATVIALRKSRNDWLFAFGLLGALMLIASPRCNPHYYVFPLFGIFWFARRLVLRQQEGRLGRTDGWLVAFLLPLMIMFGGIVPFSVFDRILPGPPNTYFHMLAVYSVQGLATFLLWCALIATRFYVDSRYTTS